MKRYVIILTAVMVMAGCSNKLKKIVTPPDATGGAVSSEGFEQSSLQGSNDHSSSTIVVSSESNQSSLGNNESINTNSSAASQMVNTSSLGAASSEASFASSATAFSSAAYSAGASSSAPPSASDTLVKMKYQEMCSSCHELTTQLPFRIGDNLSLEEMTQTIEQTMPFRHAETCVGSCAEDLAYFISESLINLKR